MSTFLGIEIGSSAIKAHKISIERAGNNISNVNTEGYSRQVVETSSNVLNGYSSLSTNITTAGAGVKIDEIKRCRDEFLDSSYRVEQNKLSSTSTLEDYMTKIETLFNSDVSSSSEDIGLEHKLSSLFNSFQDLTNDPTSVSLKQQVVEDANSVTDYFHQLNTGLDEISGNLNSDITATLDDINDIAGQIADLNIKIVSLSGKGGGGYIDLLDKRDKLLDNLSELTSVQSYTNPENEALTVYVGSSPLVSDNKSFPLSMDSRGNILYSLDNRIAYGIDSSGNEVNELNSGKLSSLMNLRDNIIPEYSDRIDSEAETLVEKFNQIQKNGYDVNGNTGVSLFKDLTDFSIVPPVTNNAGNIELSNEILSDPNYLATSVGTISSSSQMSSPGKTINSGVALASISSDTFINPPSASGNLKIGYYDETGTLNTRDIPWNTGQTLEEIINNINSSFGGINASFDSTNQLLNLSRDTSVGLGSNITVVDSSFTFPSTPAASPGTVYIQDTTGNFLGGTSSFTNIASGTVSSSSSGENANALNFANIGDEKIQGNKLTKSDIKDWQSFLTKLQSPVSGSPEERIFNLLDSTSQNIITSWTSGSTLSESDSTKLIYGLNNVIKNDTLYDSTVFTSTISQEGEELKSQYPELSATDTDRLNRLLFEGTFQQDIDISTPFTTNEDFTNILSDIGIKSRDATEFTELYTLTSEQANTLREQVSAVSLDEEFSNLIKFQKSFEAASRFVNVASEVLDTIVNNLGV